MKLNVKSPPVRTHGGAIACRVGAEQELRRSVMACLLWEDQFYENGESIADRIAGLVKEVKPERVADIAIEARSKMKLRHVPLLLAREMARHSTHRGCVETTLTNIIQRPDELAEFLAIYWKDGKCPLAASVKRGLATAFRKFNAYSLAKYNRDGAIKLRDVLFLCHAKPADAAQAKVWRQLVDGTLPAPDTWEVSLSSGGDKKAHWTRLLEEKKLGALALLRNLRNMTEAEVDAGLIKDSLREMNPERVLPFRFISAARYAHKYESELEAGMFKCLSQQAKLPGKTVLVVDVSGSMRGRLSGKSELSRMDAAIGVAMLAREVCEEPVIYATAGCDYSCQHKTELVPSRRGFALADSIREKLHSLGSGGIFLTQCMSAIKAGEKSADRVIVFTDEVDCDKKLNPQMADAFGKANYIVNVASYQNGIAYGKFTHINGWSEACLNYIMASEGVEFGGNDPAND